MPTKPNQVDLALLFKGVATTLASNREHVNQADSLNHDHGDNMVEVFNLISKAMQSQRRAAPAEQLMQASRILSERKSGSAQLYAAGLQRASGQFQGQKFLTPENIMLLIQLLMGISQQGGTQASPGQGGLGDLLGGLLGAAGQAGQAGQTPQPMSPVGVQPRASAAGAGASQGLDLGDLLNAGMAFMSAKQSGGDDLTALAQALGAGGAMSGPPHRSQSGALVVNTLLKALTGGSGNS